MAFDILFILLLILALLVWFCNSLVSVSSNKIYQGIVIEKGCDPAKIGYKSHRNAIYYLILKDQECNCSIRIHVTVPTYYKFKQGDRAIFVLDEQDLGRYGNGYKHLK